MADEAVPFNSLGQILSAGAEETLATGIALGRSSAEMFEQINKKYGPITPDTFEQLDRVAQAGVDAGVYMRGVPGSELPDSRMIPTIAELFEDQDDGSRFRYSTVWTDPLTGQTRRIYLDSPVPLTTDQIADQARSTVNKYANESPHRFGYFALEEIEQGTVRVIYAFKSN